MQEQPLAEVLDATLREYARITFGAFVRDDGKGARHSLEFDVKTSAINTAALHRLATKVPFFPGVDTAAWTDSIIVPEIEQCLEKMKSAPNARDSEYLVYRLTKMMSAVDHAGAAAALRDWLREYLSGWFYRRPQQTSVFLIHLAATALGDLRDLAGPVRRFGEAVIEHQLNLSSGTTGPNFDAIDLGLALTLAPVPPRSVQAAYDALARASSDSAVWFNRQALARLAAHAVGCSSFEVCAALLRTSPQQAFNGLRPAFARHFSWLQDQQEMRPWKVSDLYFRESVHETWFNCLVIEFLLLLRGVVEDSAQEELRTKYRARLVNKTLRWDDLILDARAKEAIATKMLQPASQHDGRKLPYSTAILFGPPGTAKTTIAELLAQELVWPFVELGVADFLRDGLDRVFATSLEIFADLHQMRHCVVLLDEVEGVFADRNEDRDLRQKFLTSALLPPLKAVRERGQILLLIATNYIREFDAAIRRQGRIDLIIPVGPPDLAGRAALLHKLPIGLSEATSAALAKLMPEGTSLAEVLAVEKLVPPQAVGPAAEAQELFARWTGRQPEIHRDALAEFEEGRQRYERYE